MSPDYMRRGERWALGTGEEKPATFSVESFLELMRGCGLEATSFFPVLVDLYPEVPVGIADFQRNLAGINKVFGKHGVEARLLSEFIGEETVRRIEKGKERFRKKAEALMKQPGILSHLRVEGKTETLTQLMSVMSLYCELGRFCRERGLVIVDCQGREYPGQQPYYGDVARVRIGDDLHRRLYGV
jgi:hypothetical protein